MSTTFKGTGKLDDVAARSRRPKPKICWNALISTVMLHCLFMNDFRVSYTNNQAEQDVRMIKVHQKIPGTYHSMESAQTFCRIRGYIPTLKKQRQPVLDYTRRAFQGNPFMPQSTES